MNDGKKKENLYSSRGGRLQVARKSAGMTQSELAEKAGFNDGCYISKMENGQKNITDENTARFAEVLNVPVEWLRCLTDWDLKDDEVNRSMILTPWSLRMIKDINPQDKALFDFLSFRGYKFQFCVILLFDNTEEKHLIDFSQIRGVDYETTDDLNKYPFDDTVEEFNCPNARLFGDTLRTFSSPCCFVIFEDGTIHECIIESVIINSVNLTHKAHLTFKQFRNEIYRLVTAIDFSVNTFIADPNYYERV